MLLQTPDARERDSPIRQLFGLEGRVGSLCDRYLRIAVAMVSAANPANAA
jgi:hypothetical protein